MLGHNIKGGLESLLKMLHEVNRPGLKQDLKLDDSDRLLRTILDRIESHDMTRYTKKTGPVTPLPTYEVVHVYDKVAVSSMIQTILDESGLCAEAAAKDHATIDRTLYIDQEGWNLGRNGELQLMQIGLPKAEKIWLIHISELGTAAFSTSATEAKQSADLKTILESSDRYKAFWDCRGDSDALWALYGIKLDPAAVIDLQLLDLATTDDHKRRKKVKGLRTAVQTRLNLPPEEEKAWLQTKEDGLEIAFWALQPKEKQAKEAEWAKIMHDMLWSTNADERAEAQAKYDKGGVLLGDGWKAEKAWAQQPLPDVLEKYAVGDVAVLPLLHQHFAAHPRLSAERKMALKTETEKRILGSQADTEVENSNNAPDGWTAKGWCEAVGVADEKEADLPEGSE